MKKGQIQGQVFIYILTLIITAGILIYGYNEIKKLNATSGQVQLVDFKTKLKSDIETISSDYNSVKTKTYNVPSKIKEVCFYQKNPISPLSPAINVNINNPLILDSVQDTNNNVFLVMEDTIEGMEFSGIEIDDNYIPLLCIPISSGRLKLKLEGKGDGVLVEKA